MNKIIIIIMFILMVILICISNIISIDNKRLELLQAIQWELVDINKTFKE